MTFKDAEPGVLTEESFLAALQEAFNIVISDACPVNTIMVLPSMANKLDRMSRHYRSCKVLRIDPDSRTARRVTVKRRRFAE